MSYMMMIHVMFIFLDILLWKWIMYLLDVCILGLDVSQYDDGFNNMLFS